MAVKLDSQSVFARSASVFPLLTRYFLNQPSPACAWLNPIPSIGPRECLDVINNLVGVKAAMKMIHPLDLSERMYGAVVHDSIEDH